MHIILKEHITFSSNIYAEGRFRNSEVKGGLAARVENLPLGFSFYSINVETTSRE